MGKPSCPVVIKHYSTGTSAERSGVWTSISRARMRSSPAARAASAARSPSCWRPRAATWRFAPAMRRRWTTVAALRGQGVKSWGSRIDVAETEALRAWVGKAAAALGGLDIFVANVSALAQGMDGDSWRRSLEIDIMGTVAGVEAAIPFLEQSTAGAIVVVGTTGAIEIAGPPRPYASAKAALVPYVKALARNLAARNIRAN